MEIGIYKIAETRVNEDEVKRWLEAIGVQDPEYWLGSIDPEIVSDPAMLIALAGKRCYMSFEVGLNPNVTKIREDYVKYFDNILSSGHGSVLEHSSFSFALEGVSRVFTAEMNRHRAGWAISEGSLRFIRFDKEINYWVPLSIRGEKGKLPHLLKDSLTLNGGEVIQYLIESEFSLEERKQFTREVFENVFYYISVQYAKLIAIWDMDEHDKDFHYKKIVTSCLRRIVPLGVATGGVWTGNVRALRHVLAMRCSEAAEEEICYVFSRIAAEISKSHPLLFGDFYQDDNGFWRPKYWKV